MFFDLSSAGHKRVVLLSTNVNIINTGTINTEDTSWTELESSTPEDFDGLILVATSFYPSGECKNALIDIAVGASSSEVEIASDVLVRVDGLVGSRYLSHCTVPVPVPSGTRISARCRQSESANIYVMIYGYRGGPPGGGFRGQVRTIGANLTDSGGTEIAPSGAATWTYGVWENLTASAPMDVKAMQVMVGRSQGIANTTTRTWDLQIGIGSTPHQIWMARLHCGYETNLPTPRIHQPFPVNIPAGTAIKARAQCSSTSRRELDVMAVLWG